MARSITRLQCFNFRDYIVVGHIGMREGILHTLPKVFRASLAINEFKSSYKDWIITTHENKGNLTKMWIKKASATGDI